MTAEQRAELIKRVWKDIPHNKLTFIECRKIAKDLNLTLEQVLHVYYDKRQRRLCDENIDSPNDKHSPKSKKRKKSSEVYRCLGGAKKTLLRVSIILPCHHSRKKHQGKFLWTEEIDRKLIILYARQRAVQGARPGTDWGSITDLPAPSINYKDPKRNFSVGIEYASGSGFPGERWDYFDDHTSKKALDEVFMYKWMPKLDPAKRTGSISMGMHKASLLEKDCVTEHIDSSQRSTGNQLPKLIKHLTEGTDISQKIHESLPVSNAAELFKSFENEEEAYMWLETVAVSHLSFLNTFWNILHHLHFQQIQQGELPRFHAGSMTMKKC